MDGRYDVTYYCLSSLLAEVFDATSSKRILPARRYAIAVVAMAPATSRCSTETSGRIELVFGKETSLDLP